MRWLGWIPLLLTGCTQVVAPPCVTLSAHHETRASLAEAGEVTPGETVEALLDWEAEAHPQVEADSFTVEWFAEALDGDSNGACAFDLDCGPDEVVGSAPTRLTCDLTNDVTFDACTFVARVTLNVTVFDSAICTDTLEQQELSADHPGS